MKKPVLVRRKPLFSKAMEMETIIILIALIIFLGLMAFLIMKKFKEAGL